MDRQRPRDLFDMVKLFDDSGVTPEIRLAFVAYLASHNPPRSAGASKEPTSGWRVD